MVLILYVIAAILLFLRAVGITAGRLDLGWLGLAAFVLAFAL